jgi:hypothetical protein
MHWSAVHFVVVRQREVCMKLKAGAYGATEDPHCMTRWKKLHVRSFTD